MPSPASPARADDDGVRRRRTRRRRLLLVTGSAGVLLGALAWWGFAPLPVPDLDSVLPLTGERLVLDVPSGLLTPELAELLAALHRHAQAAGIPLSRVELPALLGDNPTAWILQSRPWRVGYWQGDTARDRLWVVACGGAGRAVRRALSMPSRELVFGGRRVCLAFHDGTFVLSPSPELVRDTITRLDVAPATDVIRDECRVVVVTDGGSLAELVERVLGLPPTPRTTTAVLRRADGRWLFEACADPCEPPAPDAAEPFPRLRALFEESNVDVRRNEPLSHADGSQWTEHWELHGIERALEQLATEFEFWNERR